MQPCGVLFHRSVTRRVPRPKRVSFRSLSSYILKSHIDYAPLQSELMTHSLPKLLLDRVRDEHILGKGFGDKVAMVDGNGGSQITFQELYDRILTLARAFQKYSILPGTCLAILSPNHIDYPTAFLALGLCGAMSTTINPTYTADEIEYQVRKTNSTMIIAHPMCMDKAIAVAEKCNIPIVSLGDMDHLSSENRATRMYLTSLNQLIASEKIEHVDIEGFPAYSGTFDVERPLTIPFSSGTTGLPKGVLLSHRNVVANILQVHCTEGVTFLPNENDPDSKYGVALCPLPFFHIYGCVVGQFCPLYAGSLSVFMTQFSMQRFLEITQEYRATRAWVVPPIVLGLAKDPSVDQYDVSSLKALISGAAPLGTEVQALAAKRLNCIVKQAWGMSELSPVGAITRDCDWDPSDVAASLGTSGVLPPMTEAKIVDPLTGEVLPPTSEGELYMRGPQRMMGYFEAEEATRHAFDAEGFLRTGDIAKFDERGMLYITDRVKELIKYKGFQVAPAEVEACICSMEGVADCAVIPALCEERGELPRAYVVKKEANLTEEEVKSFVADRLSRHKHLHGGVVFTDAIPKSPSGKLLRRLLIQTDRERSG